MVCGCAHAGHGGGAGLASPSDDAALYVNPAALAGVKKFDFTGIAANIEGSTDVYTNYATDIAAFSNFTTSSIDAVMGQDIYARAEVTPTLIAPNMAGGIYVDGQAGIVARNEQLPQITLMNQVTYGMQFGYGTSLLGRKALRNPKMDFRVGAAVKFGWRRGGTSQLDLTDLLNLESNYSSYLYPVPQFGIGVDLGMQFINNFSKMMSLSWGLTYQDVGNTAYGSADAQPQNVSTGVSFTYKVPGVTATVAYDIRHLTDDADFMKKNHVGLAVKIPLIDLYAGVYQTSITYGASVDLWLFNISVATYSEEQGTYAFQDPENRWVARIGVKIGI